MTKIISVPEQLRGLRPRGIIALSDCTLSDATFSESQLPVEDIINQLELRANQLPHTVAPIQCYTPGGAQVAAQTAVGFSTADLIAVIAPSYGIVPYGDGFPPQFLGLLIAQRFTADASAAPFVCKVRYIGKQVTAATGASVYSVISSLNRDITVEPQQGANSSLEYLIFNMCPAVRLGYDSTNKDIDTAQAQNNGSIYPLVIAKDASFVPLTESVTASVVLGGTIASADNGSGNEGICAIIVTLEGQASVSQQASVVPIFCTAETPQSTLSLFTRALGAR